MKVRIISKETIWDYCRNMARSQSSFYVFLEKIENCNWRDLNQIKDDFPRMSIVGNCERNRIIFNIGGNHYRGRKTEKTANRCRFFSNRISYKNRHEQEFNCRD